MNNHKNGDDADNSDYKKSENNHNANEIENNSNSEYNPDSKSNS